MKSIWFAFDHMACRILLPQSESERLSPEVGAWRLHHETDRCACMLIAQSCPTLCNHMDRSPPGSSVHGILQARTLEWVAMPSSRGSSQPRDRT